MVRCINIFPDKIPNKTGVTEMAFCINFVSPYPLRYSAFTLRCIRSTLVLSEFVNAARKSGKGKTE